MMPNYLFNIFWIMLIAATQNTPQKITRRKLLWGSPGSVITIMNQKWSKTGTRTCFNHHIFLLFTKKKISKGLMPWMCRKLKNNSILVYLSTIFQTIYHHGNSTALRLMGRKSLPSVRDNSSWGVHYQTLMDYIFLNQVFFLNQFFSLPGGREKYKKKLETRMFSFSK